MADITGMGGRLRLEMVAGFDRKTRPTSSESAAIINTAVGVTNALSTGMPPWNFAQAALIAAQGAAQIATIRSTNEDGGGGSASPSAAPAAAAAPADLGRSLTIEGIDSAHLFSGGQVRGLIESINEEVRNGATLISSGRLSS